MLRFKIKPLLAQLEFEQRRKISLGELAAEAGTNRATLSRMVNQPGVVVRTDVLDALCRFFNCGIADLVEYVSDDAPERAPAGVPSVREEIAGRGESE